MKPARFYIAVALGAICLTLAITVIAVSQENQSLQTRTVAQQEEINRGEISRQISTDIVQDAAAQARNNQTLRDLLARHGYSVTAQQPFRAFGNRTGGNDGEATETPPATVDAQ